MEWIKINTGSGVTAAVNLPELGRHVLLYLPCPCSQTLPILYGKTVVGYLYYNREFREDGGGPCGVVQPSHWCDCLDDDFQSPIWPGESHTCPMTDEQQEALGCPSIPKPAATDEVRARHEGVIRAMLDYYASFVVALTVGTDVDAVRRAAAFAAEQASDRRHEYDAHKSASEQLHTVIDSIDADGAPERAVKACATCLMYEKACKDNRAVKEADDILISNLRQDICLRERQVALLNLKLHHEQDHHTRGRSDQSA